MVRRLDRQGEVLIWCRKCSGCGKVYGKWAQKSFGKMSKRIQVLGDGRIRVKEAGNWNGIQKIVERVGNGRIHGTERSIECCKG